MASEVDPQGAETEALFEAADFFGARVLEIGSGGGRLTRRYAGACLRSVAVDPVIDEIASATATRPVGLRGRSSFVPATAMALPFSDRTFDIALLAWSL